MSDREVARAQNEDRYKEEMHTLAAELETIQEDSVSARPKRLKCSKCYVEIDYDAAQIDLTTSTCDHSACGIKQVAEFMDKMHEKRPKKKVIPALLKHKDDEEDRQVRHIRDILAEAKVVTANHTPVSQSSARTFEVEVPDPIVIFIHKNGHVEVRAQ